MPSRCDDKEVAGLLRLKGERSMTWLLAERFHVLRPLVNCYSLAEITKWIHQKGGLSSVLTQRPAVFWAPMILYLIGQSVLRVVVFPLP